MYHYVREYDNQYPYFRYLDIRNFRKQLDFFEKKYGFVKKSEWDDFVNFNFSNKSDGKIILTFDDAMSCHYDYVFPELEKRGLWGIFYVPTLPYINNKILDVHRIHLLTGTFDGRDLYSELLGLINYEMMPKSIRDDFKTRYGNQDNYHGVTEFKKILNYYIDDKYKKLIIDQISKKFSYNFDGLSFYVSIENLKKIKESGSVIGSHTVSHPLMSKLSKSEQRNQINKSFIFLESLGFIDEKTYCHPYGGFSSFNDHTVDLLSISNIKYSFSVEPRDIVENDMTTSRQFLPRYDCTYFKYGKAS